MYRAAGIAVFLTAGATSVYAGPLTDDAVGMINGDGVVVGSTLLKDSDNDFNGRFGLSNNPADFWGGADEVWIIDHGGGVLNVEMSIDDPVEDLDLYLFGMDVAPSGFGSEITFSQSETPSEFFSTTLEEGRYFLLVDTYTDIGSTYTLNVDGTPVPAPASVALFGLTAFMVSRQRRL